MISNVFQCDENSFFVEVTPIRFVSTLISLTKLLYMCLWFYVCVEGFIQFEFSTIYYLEKVGTPQKKNIYIYIYKKGKPLACNILYKKKKGMG